MHHMLTRLSHYPSSPYSPQRTYRKDSKMHACLIETEQTEQQFGFFLPANRILCLGHSEIARTEDMPIKRIEVSSSYVRI